MDTILSVFYPKDLGMGALLSIICSLLVLHILWEAYKDKYSFTTKEKAITMTLSVLFMLAGTIVAGSVIPIVTWALFAFQFAVDRKYMMLPDGVNILIGISAIYAVIFNSTEMGWLQGGLITSVILFAVFLGFAFLGPMGGGDIKMMTATGLFFVVWDIPALIFFGFLIGAVQGVSLLLVHKKKKDAVFAFGPALILGILVFVMIRGGVFIV